MKTFYLLPLALSIAVQTVPAAAATFVVDAAENSSNTGAALDTGLFFNSGDTLSISSDINDLWSAGPLPRFSDANGLIGPRFASSFDDSGQAPGTLIGSSFGLLTQSGFSAPFGSLVGRIGGEFRLIGTNFAGPAWNTGNLELLYWDSNGSDNAGDISFQINSAGAVPEPGTWAMMLLGFGAIGFGMRRRKGHRIDRRIRLSYT